MNEPYSFLPHRGAQGPENSYKDEVVAYNLTP